MELLRFEGSISVSQSDLTTEVLEKQVCSLTKLTRRLPVPSCIAMPYDPKNPLLKVHEMNLKLLWFQILVVIIFLPLSL
jgi:hypothetical protein